jgi:hypothetical protein
MYLTVINLSNIFLDTVIWLFHVFVFFIPYYATRHFVIQDEKKTFLITFYFYDKVFLFLKYYIKSCIVLVLTIFGGKSENTEMTDNNNFSIDINQIITWAIIIFISTLIGFISGFRKLDDNFTKETIERLKNKKI